MNTLVLVADVGALLVLMWATYVVGRFVIAPATRPRDRWERENMGEKR